LNWNFRLTDTEVYTVVPHTLFWTFTLPFLSLYIVFILSSAFYVIGNSQTYLLSSKAAPSSTFFYLSGLEILALCLTPLLFILSLFWVWSGPTVLAWFSHLLFTNFQLKVSYLVLFTFTCLLTTLASYFYYTSTDVFDYTTVLFNFFLWVLFLFFSNNLFTFIFFLELLSVLTTLLLVTATFSSTFFYNNLNLSKTTYFSASLPLPFLQTLLFFFWVSLISALNLFLFLIFLYLRFLTFDWFLLEAIFAFHLTLFQLKNLFFTAVIWFNFIFCLFLKCGLVPFFFWKPTFFKGTPLHTLAFYITFYYFFLICFFTYFLCAYLADLFFFFTMVNLAFLLIGYFFLIFIILESFYLKTFLAISSIINTFFVLLALSSLDTTALPLLL